MKKHSKIKIFFLIILITVLVMLFGTLIFFRTTRNPRIRLFVSNIRFMSETLENPGYLLYNVDIMELCREYINADTEVTGRVGMSGMRQVKSSVYFDMTARRSFDQKRFSVNCDMDLLFLNLGQLNFYAEDNVVYLTAPLLDDEFGYAFPMEKSLFEKAPDMTHDIDKQWFKDNMGNIIDFIRDISIEETGKTILDNDGTVSDEFVITMHAGSGKFIWDLLGMETPDYDATFSIYLTKDNHMRRLYMDLKDELPGAYVTLDGKDAGDLYIEYDLPQNEKMEISAHRNLEHSNWIDLEAVYHANTKKDYKATGYMTWKDTGEKVEVRVKNGIVKCDEKIIAKGYFAGGLRKLNIDEDVWYNKEDFLYNLEELDWRSVRDNTEDFVKEVLGKTSFSSYLK